MSLMRCPSCHREYDEGYLKCPYDGSALIDATAEHDPFVGRQLAETYQVIRRIGAGGMGAVYQARHVRLGTSFAVKMLYPELSLNEELLARFHREARSASQLRHPNIVDVLDVNRTSDGIHYIIVEFLHGEPLGDAVAAGPMSLARGVRILIQVCDAMAAAHAERIIHRDLKPENIYLCNDGGRVDFVKVLDFGIAKMQEEGKANLTQFAQVMGTPDYISPEQARNSRDADARSDIYSLGVVVYRMFTGRLPYEITSPAMALEAVKDKPGVSAIERRPDIPAEILSIIERSMAREPSDRYATMLEFKDELVKVLGEPVASGDSIPHTMYAPSAPDPKTGPPTQMPRTVASSPHMEPPSVDPTSSIIHPGTSSSVKSSKTPLIAGVLTVLLLAGGVGGYMLSSQSGPGDSGSDAATSVDDAAAAVDGAASAGDATASTASKASPTSADPQVEGMRYVKRGTIMIGRDDGKLRERPAHECTISAFHIDTIEVTRAAFAAHLPAPKNAKQKKVWGAMTFNGGDGKLPMVNVTWDQAQAFCKALNKRLPSEEEWEYAARGGEKAKARYEADKRRLDGANVCRGASQSDCAGRHVRKASEAVAGLSDMIGNAGEWVSSTFRGYTNTCGKRTQLPPKLRHPAQRNFRVIRGGSFDEYHVDQLTPTYRFYYYRDGFDATIGFRCAKDAQ